MNVSHVARRRHTSFINNFKRITTFIEFRQIYRRLSLRLAQSSHQINLESFFHLTLIVFAADFEQVDISSVIFL